MAIRLRVVTDRDGHGGKWAEPKNGGDPFGVARTVLEVRKLNPALGVPVLRSTFVDLLGFGPLAELVAGAEVGQILQVEGDIQATDWVSKDGTKNGTDYSIVAQGINGVRQFAQTGD